MVGTATDMADTAAREDAPRPLAWLRHALCVLALMWTGIVNGQPFFFADTTNYIRAADIAVYMASGRTAATVWTERYRAELPSGDPGAAATPRAAPTGEAAHLPTANDVGAGLVMSGRSPYIGFLMYLGWVIGWFWPFVLLQALVAYALIILTLRRFGVDRPAYVTALTLALAATTALPTYNSLLLADGFASFGVLAFALIALPGRLSRLELAFLVAVLLVSVTAHLTHVMMLVGMIIALGLLAAFRLLRPPPRAWITAAAALVVAVLALQATTFATRVALGRDPQLLPLLTARFYMDGPGKAFVDSGCEGMRFEVCRLPIKAPVNNAGWLFEVDPPHAAYMLATPAQRRVMGEQDVAFALAVLRHYPLEQVGASFRNTISQALWIDYDGLNQGCFGTRPGCWENLPPPVLATFKRTLSGRNAWPVAAMNALLYAVVLASLLLLAVSMRALAAHDRAAFRGVRDLLAIVVAAMLVCSAFGGAVADPQYRYQGRLIWMIVLVAAVAALRARAYLPAPSRGDRLPLARKDALGS